MRLCIINDINITVVLPSSVTQLRSLASFLPLLESFPTPQQVRISRWTSRKNIFINPGRKRVGGMDLRPTYWKYILFSVLKFDTCNFLQSTEDQLEILDGYSSEGDSKSCADDDGGNFQLINIGLRWDVVVSRRCLLTYYKQFYLKVWLCWQGVYWELRPSFVLKLFPKTLFMKALFTVNK